MQTLGRFANIDKILFSEDQKSLIVFSNEEVAAFDLNTYEQLETIPTYQKPVDSEKPIDPQDPQYIAKILENRVMSPDGQYYLKAKAWEPVGLYLCSDNTMLTSLSIETYDEANASDYCFSPDGTLVAIGTTEMEFTGSLFVFELKSKQQVACHSCHQCISKVLFFSDNKQIVYSDLDGAIYIYSLEQNKVLYSNKTHSSFLGKLLLSPDDKQVISFCSKDNNLNIWNYGETHKQKPVLNNDGIKLLPCLKDRYLTNIFFSANGERMVTLFSNGSSFLWDSTSMNQITSLIDSNTILLMGSTAIAITFSHDQQKIICAKRDGIYEWSSEDGQLLNRKEENIEHWRRSLFSPDRKILTIFRDDITEWINLETFERKFFEYQPLAYEYAYSHDSKKLVLASESGDLSMMDVYNTETISPFYTSDDSIHAIAFSKDNNYIAVWNSGIVVIDLKSYEVLHKFSYERKHQECVAISPGGQSYELSFCENGKLLFIQNGINVDCWDWRKGNLVETKKGDIWSLENAQYMLVPDGIDMAVKSVVDGKLIKRFPVKLDKYTPHPNGKSWVGWSGKNTLYQLM
ncbi:hypothetical protein [Candidatus Uabimicrobium amorphum]|uniref:Anaphase-promoting complex subunit 4 WD40 domain-containing protein n=1 Tax=Uabimicrobium amorphum TaxID=2596890 RepID=A0A5S9IR94_UABAM|nr:hypothetical protein [Candidatus Uabimicrobium amorphum]BBM86629.1 hypothetical protein UABAM_05015 [Candidatus Uabimicrobium amorphum]